VALDVPDMVLALSDTEYEGLVNALSFNFAELPAGTCQHPHMRALRHAVMQLQHRMEQQQQQQQQQRTSGQQEQGKGTEGGKPSSVPLHKQRSSRAVSGSAGACPRYAKQKKLNFLR